MYPAMQIKYFPSCGNGRRATVRISDGKMYFRVDGRVPTGRDFVAPNGEISIRTMTMGSLRGKINCSSLAWSDTWHGAWDSYLVGTILHDPTTLLIDMPETDCSCDRGATLNG